MILLLSLLLQESKDIAQEVARANDREKPYHVQLQAIRKLKERGGAAVAAEIVSFVAKKGHGALSPGFTESLGSLKDERITKLLRELTQDRDFDWRPLAVRSLVEHGDKGSLGRYRAELADPLWVCRASGIKGIEKVDDRESIPRVRELLGDEVYDVRSQAARTLYAFGDESGLPVLVEALRDATAWFDIDYGQHAREDAWEFLKTIAKDEFGFKPWESAEQRAPGLAKFEAWIAGRIPDWRKKIPEKARANSEGGNYLFGYEIRSCQKGEFFLRLDQEGTLILGCFNLEKIKLDEKDRQALLAAIEKVKATDKKVLHGQPGCDAEQYYVKSGDHFERLWIGLRGRPQEIQPLTKMIADLLTRKFGAGAASEFREKALLFQAEE